jgi:hypothetical protein
MFNTRNDFDIKETAPAARDTRQLIGSLVEHSAFVSHATHSNAALTPRARLRPARLIVDQGWTSARAAERYDVSWKTDLLARRSAPPQVPVGSQPLFIQPPLVVAPHDEKRHHERNTDQHQYPDL